MVAPIPAAIITALAALIGTSQAVFVCSGFNSVTGGCEQPCTEISIGDGQLFNTPGTNCIFNADNDPGFDLKICSGANLGPPCSFLHDQPRVDITGDFNWHTPGTGSILRTGD
ncbi:hypothetical protein QBC35DRAFT_450407 [Podospora australis]|uniref:Cyanovirin-N domain-containing protein n=1 Tax=Podospora australis TaxID=1536484 RepID=A0AAN6WVZ8_9PEZI|nr:hypothetical protein QBC35DRAFT_450407 [Podospora australis]